MVSLFFFFLTWLYHGRDRVCSILGSIESEAVTSWSLPSRGN